MATHSSTLACKIPLMEKPGRLQSMGSLGVRHDWATSLSLFTFHFHPLEKETATHSSVLAWRIPGTVEPSGLPSMGSHRVGHNWSDLAAAAAAASWLWNYRKIVLILTWKQLQDHFVFPITSMFKFNMAATILNDSTSQTLRLWP